MDAAIRPLPPIAPIPPEEVRRVIEQMRGVTRIWLHVSLNRLLGIGCWGFRGGTDSPGNSRSNTG